MLLSSILFPVLYGSWVKGAAFTASQNHASHRVWSVGRDLKVEVFHPKSNYRTFGAGIDLPPSFSSSSISDKSLSFISSQLNIDSSRVAFKSGYESEVGQVGYIRQAHDGIPFVNAVANVAFKGDKAVAFGNSFVDTSNIAPSNPTIDVAAVIPKIETFLGGKRNKVEPTLAYLAQPDGKVALVHTFQIQNDASGQWVEAHVDAHSGDLLSMTNFVADISYTVLPIWKETIDEGIEILDSEPENDASPNGWHDDPVFFPETRGNNIFAFIGDQTRMGANFSSVYDPTLQPSNAVNINAALTNAFYIMNSYHDTLYLYGFTESAFNFQNNNFGKAGEGNDRVLVSVQDRNGINNADFATPPDGQSGRARFFLFNLTQPDRDSSMENDILIHEMTHGLSNRLTGGGTGQCLQTVEAAGLGEGWSDAVADWFAHSDFPTVKDFSVGTWVTNNLTGGRRYLYSTNNATNPLRYSSIATMDELHDIGEVWANILHNIYAALINEKGFSSTARNNATGTEGNPVFFHLLVDALALQPCNPTFIAARDAWIQSDQIRYNGQHRCLLWREFAVRGLGVDAGDHGVESTVFPPDC